MKEITQPTLNSLAQTPLTLLTARPGRIGRTPTGSITQQSLSELYAYAPACKGAFLSRDTWKERSATGASVALIEVEMTKGTREAVLPGLGDREK